MKKLIKLSVVAGIFSLFISLTNAVYAKEDVPAEVAISFYHRYPGAVHVTWKPYNGDQYMASFILNENEAHAFYSNKGEFIESDIMLNDANIPVIISDQLSTIRNYVLYYVLDTTDANENEYYRVKIKVENVFYELDFDKDQNLISKRVLK